MSLNERLSTMVLRATNCAMAIQDRSTDLLGPEGDLPRLQIGIGAGAGTDGQVLVFDDVLGLGSGRYPKFVRSYAHLADEAVEALKAYKADVEAGSFPGEDESYHIADEVASELLKGTQSG